MDGWMDELLSMRSLFDSDLEFRERPFLDWESDEHLSCLLLDHSDVEEDGFVVRLDVHRLKTERTNNERKTGQQKRRGDRGGSDAMRTRRG